MAIQDLNTEAVALVQRIAATAKLIEQLQSELTQVTGKIVDAINAGESTGDPIRDFVIVAHNTIDNRYFDWYKRFKGFAKNHVGQFVLIAFSWEQDRFGIHYMSGANEDQAKKNFMPPPSGKEWVYKLSLGVLKDEGLVLDHRIKPHALCAFDVAKFGVHSEDGIDGWPGPMMLLTQSSRGDSLTLLADNAVNPNANPFDVMIINSRVEVMIGNEAIKEWATTVPNHYWANHNINSLCKLLGKEPLLV